MVNEKEVVKKQRGRPRKYPEGAKRVDNTSIVVTKKQKDYLDALASLREETLKETSNRILADILAGKHDDLLTTTDEEVPATPITVNRVLAHKVQKYLKGYNENTSTLVRKILEGETMEKILTTVDGYELGVTTFTEGFKRFWIRVTPEAQEHKFYTDASIQLANDNEHVVVHEKSIGVRPIAQMYEISKYKAELIQTALQLQKELDKYLEGGEE